MVINTFSNVTWPKHMRGTTTLSLCLIMKRKGQTPHWISTPSLGAPTYKLPKPELLKDGLYGALSPTFTHSPSKSSRAQMFNLLLLYQRKMLTVIIPFGVAMTFVDTFEPHMDSSHRRTAWNFGSHRKSWLGIHDIPLYESYWRIPTHLTLVSAES